MVGGLSWGYVGPSWGYVGLSWGQCGPILGLCWPILELCWPILGLCWPILGPCWPILRPMLAHLEAYVGRCWPIRNHKSRKMAKNGKSTKHRKTRGFLAGPRGRRQGARPLSPTERRETAVRLCHGQGPDGKTPWQWRKEKHQNCTPKLPNVTFETHRKWWFSYFFLPSAAAAPSVQRTAAGWENTMAVKDGEASKLHPKTP